MTYGPPTAQEHLRQSNQGSINYINRAPMCCSEGIETVEEVKPTPVWKIVGGFVLAAALVVCVISVARAAEPPKGVAFVIWNETTDSQAHVHQFTSPTACNTDLGGVAKTMPDGSRLSCRKVKLVRARVPRPFVSNQQE
jgi:hypothetical protein